MSLPPESKRNLPAETPLSAGLYIVSTPIGNAADVTLRALDVLRRVDVLAAEDTRQLRKLMDIHGVAGGGRRILSYNDRNGPARRPQLIAELAAGRSVAYCSDAGTPLIADPGYRLVADAIAAGITVVPVPGASACMAALSVAGQPTDRFLFLGFLPTRSGQRRQALSEVAGVPSTLVIYESPRRLAASLADMVAVLGPDRPAAIARELTKAFEEVRRGTLADLVAAVPEMTAKGEIVIVCGPPDGAVSLSDEDRDRALIRAMETASVKDAARQVAEATGLPRRDLYARALVLRSD